MIHPGQLEKNLTQVVRGYGPSARRIPTEVTCQEQAGELLVANPKSDIYIEYCRTVRTLAWLRALHPLTVSNVSPERCFSVALGCRK